MTQLISPEGVMVSIEFIKYWFKKAAKEAKNQRKTDSEALWRDGLEQLEIMETQLAQARERNRELEAREVAAVKIIIRFIAWGQVLHLVSPLSKTNFPESLLRIHEDAQAFLTNAPTDCVVVKREIATEES